MQCGFYIDAVTSCSVSIYSSKKTTTTNYHIKKQNKIMDGQWQEAMLGYLLSALSVCCDSC